MSSFLKRFAPKKQSSGSRSSPSQGLKIVQHGFVQFDEGGASSSSAAQQLKTKLQLQPEEVKELHSKWGAVACSNLRRETESSGWEVWEQKDGLTISRKTTENNHFVGKGEIKWTVPMLSEIRPLKDDENDQPLYDIEFIDKFLWDDKTKQLYDEFTDSMLVLYDHEGMDCHVVDQVFKGRFGIAGRDFVVCIKKQREDDDEYERVVIGAESVSEEHVEFVEAALKPEKVNQYYETKNRVVRGFCHTAGFVLSHKKGTNEFVLSYLNDADVKSRGVPKWIVNRVKLDQLKIVQNIPECLKEHALNENLTSAEDIESSTQAD